jgi:hypothetical protein
MHSKYRVIEEIGLAAIAVITDDKLLELFKDEERTVTYEVVEPEDKKGRALEKA